MPRIRADPTGEELSPTRLPPSLDSLASSQVVTRPSEWLAIKCSRTLPEFDNLLERPTEFRETFIDVYGLLTKNITMDTGDQPEEEMHRTK